MQMCIQEHSSVLAAECASALLTSSFAHSCNPPEAFISVGGLYPPLRRICFISPLIEVGVSPTEINGLQKFLQCHKPLCGSIKSDFVRGEFLCAANFCARRRHSKGSFPLAYMLINALNNASPAPTVLTIFSGFALSHS